MDVTTIVQLIDAYGLNVVLIAVALFLLYKLWPYITDALTKGGERNEIIRNNTAAIDNNTAVLQMVISDRDKTCEIITKHDADAKARDARLESKIEGVGTELGKARGEIGIIRDRL